MVTDNPDLRVVALGTVAGQTRDGGPSSSPCPHTSFGAALPRSPRGLMGDSVF